MTMTNTMPPFGDTPVLLQTSSRCCTAKTKTNTNTKTKTKTPFGHTCRVARFIQVLMLWLCNRFFISLWSDNHVADILILRVALHFLRMARNTMTRLASRWWRRPTRRTRKRLTLFLLGGYQIQSPWTNPTNTICRCQSKACKYKYKSHKYNL